MISVVGAFGPVRAVDILFFNQDCNLESPMMPDSSCGDERYNLSRILENLGHNLTILTDFHQANLADLLAANDIFFIPDIEDQIHCNPMNLTFLPASAKTDISDYVEGGGRLIVSGSAQGVFLLNELFNLSLGHEGNTSMGLSTKNEAQAIGTTYESCPSTIPNLDVTFLITSSMPPDKKCIYESGGHTSLALFNVGAGEVAFLGFDFNDSGPGCTNDGTPWLSCGLESAISTFIPPPSPPSVPTLSQWSLYILGLICLIVGTVSIRSTQVAPIQ